MPIAAEPRKKAARIPRDKEGGPTRRSARVLGMEAVVHEDSTVGFDDDVRSGPSRAAKKRRRATIAAGPKPPAADSSRALDCDTAALELGCQARDFGKAAVMKLCCPGHAAPKFSKMSGVVEWANAVFLWVNVGGNSFKNVFKEASDGCVHMDWFASARHHEKSRIILRLLAGGESQVLLFCRLPSEPYIYCGRLSLVSFDPNSEPLHFTWSLVDTSKLTSTAGWAELLACNRKL
ncbi:unnamed protein product [Chrysoparadoxa australica]